jgi:hypothetical protein
MVAQRVLEAVIDLNDANTTPTLTAGTANSESEVARFTVPNRTAYRVQAGISTMSVTLQSTTPTQLAGSSRVRITAEDPNGQIRRVIVDANYIALSEQQNRNLMYVMQQNVVLSPQDVVRLLVTGDLAAATAQTRFRFASVRRRTTI